MLTASIANLQVAIANYHPTCPLEGNDEAVRPRAPSEGGMWNGVNHRMWALAGSFIMIAIHAFRAQGEAAILRRENAALRGQLAARPSVTFLLSLLQLAPIPFGASPNSFSDDSKRDLVSSLASGLPDQRGLIDALTGKTEP